MLRFTEAGTNTKDCPQAPGVCVSSVAMAQLSILWKSRLVFIKRKRRAWAQEVCASGPALAGMVHFSLCQSLVQLRPCPHPANLVSVPSCTQACAVLLYPGWPLEPHSDLRLLQRRERAGAQEDANTCVLLRGAFAKL